MTRTVVLVSSAPRPGLAEQIAAGEAPRRDYFELRDMLDAALWTAPTAPGPVYRLLQRVGGHALAMAVRAWWRRGSYDTILTDQESAGIILALLFKLPFTRRKHVMISHYLTPAKKQIFFRRLKVQSRIDRTICYSTAQEQVARQQLGLRKDQVSLILHPADSRFWCPARSEAEIEADGELLRQAGLFLPTAAPVICSAGLEFRDYGTLIDAVKHMPGDIHVVIAAASPWSKRTNTAANVELPENVHVVALKPLQLRALYRRALVVALPLFDVDFQAGSLVAYEALACGRPVVITRTRGQADIVQAGVTGLYVPPGDVDAMAEALNELLVDPERAAMMGRAARERVEAGLNLDTYLAQMVAVVREVSGDAPRPTLALDRSVGVDAPPADPQSNLSDGGQDESAHADHLASRAGASPVPGDLAAAGRVSGLSDR